MPEVSMFLAYPITDGTDLESVGRLGDLILGVAFEGHAKAAIENSAEFSFAFRDARIFEFNMTGYDRRTRAFLNDPATAHDDKHYFRQLVADLDIFLVSHAYKGKFVLKLHASGAQQAAVEASVEAIETEAGFSYTGEVSTGVAIASTMHRVFAWEGAQWDPILRRWRVRS